MIRPAILLLVLAVPLAAAELVVRDIRVGVSTLPSAFDWSLESRSGSVSGSDGFDAGLGLEGGIRWSFARVGDDLGVVVGSDLLLDAWDYAGSGSLAATGLRLSAGPGWAVSDRWTLSAMLGAQYAISRLDLPATASSPDFSGTGSALGFDARADARWLLRPGFGLTATVGWLVSSHDFSGSEDVAITIDQSSWFVGIGAVWRFSDTPTRIE